MSEVLDDQRYQDKTSNDYLHILADVCRGRRRGVEKVMRSEHFHLDAQVLQSSQKDLEAIAIQARMQVVIPFGAAFTICPIVGDAGLQLFQRVLVSLDAAKFNTPFRHTAHNGACLSGHAVLDEEYGLDLLPWCFGRVEGEDLVFMSIRDWHGRGHLCYWHLWEWIQWVVYVCREYLG